MGPIFHVEVEAMTWIWTAREQSPIDGKRQSSVRVSELLPVSTWSVRMVYETTRQSHTYVKNVPDEALTHTRSRPLKTNIIPHSTFSAVP
jgi:hypothetical protein